ncbi:MAG: bifunctional pyr operon transcriptional regulator/uracil phosphoribosyltransferase PyrR [Opitutales bacterium]
MTEAERISHQPIAQALRSLVSDILNESFASPGNICVVGIAEGGIQVSQRIASALEQELGATIDHGTIDITFHRDDIGLKPITRMSFPTNLGFPIDDRIVILCDDVIFSGRTIRAALNELFDQGRPEAIRLAVLFDRGHRKLPVQPTYTGFSQPVEPGRTVSVELAPAYPEQDRIVIGPA